MARVLFVCHQNAGRSQMSEALFHRAAGDRHESRSAGTRPAERVHAAVVEAMREVGIDLSQKRPAPLTDDLARWPAMVVTMGCGEECPVIPGKTYVDWDLSDPAGKPLDQVRALRVDIDRRVRQLAQDLDAADSAASNRPRDA